MRRYLIRRLAQLVPVLLGIGLVTFLIVRLAPGDPAAMLVDTTLLSREELARFRAEMGLDAPWPVQFVGILKQLATGEIHSFRTGQPVLTMLAERLPITAALLGGAIVLSLLLGVPMGVLSARRPGSRLDNWLSVCALGGVSLPGFWFGLVLMWVFAGVLRVLPATGTGPATSWSYTARDMVPYFIMPTVVLAAGILPPVMRYTRSSMLEALAQDYVRTARSKGLSESLVLYRHALRNALLPAFDRKLAVPEYDVAKAKNLLAEAGWRPGSDGVLEKDGKRFAFSIVNFAGPSRTMAIVYQDAWKKLGLDVSVDTVDFPTLWGVRFHPGKFEAISFLWPSGFYPDPAVGLYPFLCANSRSGYCSAEMDRLIVAGRSTLNPAERVRIYARFQELFARDQPFMWVVSPADLRLQSPKLVLPERQNDFLVMKAILDWDLKE